MSYREVYEKWCNDPYFDEASREELKALEGNEAEIEDRFYRQLEFGTGGLRGVIGAGTNRMNIYTVRQATQGLANYIISQNGQEKGVAIAHDSRRMSPEFAREAALCLNANGIKTYLFESLRPTPELSFAVREFGCISATSRKSSSRVACTSPLLPFTFAPKARRKSIAGQTSSARSSSTLTAAVRKTQYTPNATKVWVK